MDDMPRREADEWMRKHLSDRLNGVSDRLSGVSERLAANETAQKFYHDEVKALAEGLYRQIVELKADNKALREEVDSLKWFQWKTVFVGAAILGVIAFMLKLFAPAINKIAASLFGESPVQEYIQQRTRTKIQMFNRKTGTYDYYIQFDPVGNQGQHTTPKRKDDETD